MNLRIRRTGGLVWFTPRMRVSYRPRGSFAALARQYFQYGRWRRVVMRQHQGSASPRYLAAPAALVGVAVGSVIGAGGILTGRPLLLLGFLLPAGYAVAVSVGAVV